MILLSSTSSGTGTTEPTENLLKTGGSRTTSSYNTGKTKELVVDFSRHTQSCTQVNIWGMDTEMVTSYKCLGVHMNSKLDWTDHIQQRTINFRADSIC